MYNNNCTDQPWRPLTIDVRENIKFSNNPRISSSGIKKWNIVTTEGAFEINDSVKNEIAQHYKNFSLGYVINPTISIPVQRPHHPPTVHLSYQTENNKTIIKPNKKLLLL